MNDYIVKRSTTLFYVLGPLDPAIDARETICTCMSEAQALHIAALMNRLAAASTTEGKLLDTIEGKIAAPTQLLLTAAQ